MFLTFHSITATILVLLSFSLSLRNLTHSSFCPSNFVEYNSIPHYEVLSRPVEAGRLSVVVNYVRKMLIEDVYARLCVMFPETVNWLGSPDE